MTPTIVEFLEARIAEDEADARAAVDDDRPGTHWQWVSDPTDEVLDADALQSAARWEAPEGLMMSLRTVEHFPTTSGVGPLPAFPLQYIQWDGPSGVYQHIARHDPARVLAECKAKRAIVGQHVMEYPGPQDGPWAGPTSVCRECGSIDNGDPCHVLVLLAQPYRDHAEYDLDWEYAMRMDGLL